MHGGPSGPEDMNRAHALEMLQHQANQYYAAMAGPPPPPPPPPHPPAAQQSAAGSQQQQQQQQQQQPSQQHQQPQLQHSQSLIHSQSQAALLMNGKSPARDLCGGSAPVLLKPRDSNQVRAK